MAEIHELGKEGEAIAIEHLTAKGYRIREKNWRSGSLEVDIIAQQGQTLVIVEVRTRSDHYLVEPSSTVTRQKQRSIIRAANIYVQRNNIDLDCRFDIISVTEHKGQMVIDHIEDAFYARL